MSQHQMKMPVKLINYNEIIIRIELTGYLIGSLEFQLLFIKPVSTHNSTMITSF